MALRIDLNDGSSMPTLGLGTWPMDDAEAERVVALALELGYRHVDTAVRYGNERGVGRALAASGLPRDEVYVTTKLDGEHQGAGKAVDGLRASLDRLGLEQVDLLLIHWPLPGRDL
ncbi:MAG TPA: aldo/keto reductase, partial [Trueperaceae bacterium]|nr:aldo/keto reductase [Trueperaceae bacterium]